MTLWRRSLAARLLILFLLLALAPLALASGLVYDLGRRRIAANVQAHLESVAILKGQVIEEWVEHLEHTIVWLATRSQIQEAAAGLAAHASDDAEYAAAHDALAAELRKVAALGDLAPLLLLDGVGGEIIVASEEEWEGQFRERERWYIEGRTRTWASNLYHSQRLEEATMVVAAPVRDEAGQLLGVLAGHANLEDLDEIMLERSGLGETGETYLVNAGNLLLTESRFEPGVAFRRWVFTEGVSRALVGESGVGVYRDYRGERVIGAYRWLEGLEVALLAEVDQAEAYAPISTLRRTVLGIGSGVGVAVTLLAIAVARAIIRPVRRLVEGAEEIGRGNLDYRVEVVAGDEIGQLCRAFNGMAEKLQESQERMADVLALNRRIFDVASFGIAAYEASGECVLANEAAARIMGARREQVLEQNLQQIGSWRASGLLDAAEEALRGGGMTRRQVRVRSTYGRERWLDCRFASFRLEGRPHLLAVIDDVTERKRMEEQMVRRERLTTLGQLSASIAHELRNPMGAIRNAAFFLGMAVEDPDPDVGEALEIMEDEIGRCEEIIRSLLDFVSARPPERRELPLNEVVREALREMEVPEAVDVVTELDGALPSIEADGNQLRQVLRNLLHNAVQAMPAGGRLTVKTARVIDRSPVGQRGEVTISVTDTGIGIAKEDVDRIFEPLFTTKAKGIGLGLPLARMLVERHGGRIEVESDVGVGSTFTVRLPVEKGSS